MSEINCYSCIYGVFKRCPVNNMAHNAACLTIAKEYKKMSSRELREITEEEYKKDLAYAARKYHARMDICNRLFGEEKTDENVSIH